MGAWVCVVIAWLTYGLILGYSLSAIYAVPRLWLRLACALAGALIGPLIWLLVPVWLAVRQTREDRAWDRAALEAGSRTPTYG